MAQITLYGPAGAPFVQKVAKALAYKGLDYELLEPQGQSDYRRWNPETGLLPVLDHAGERIPDSTAILEFLNDRYPQPPLLAEDPKVAEAQRRLEDWCDETFFHYWTRWNSVRESLESNLPPQPSPLALSIRRMMLRSIGLTPAEDRALQADPALVAEIGRRFDDLLNLLGTRPFFYSDHLSMADLAVWAMLMTVGRGGIPGAEVALEERPTLLEFRERVEKATSGGGG